MAVEQLALAPLPERERRVPVALIGMVDRVRRRGAEVRRHCPAHDSATPLPLAKPVARIRCASACRESQPSVGSQRHLIVKRRLIELVRAGGLSPRS